MATSLKHLSPLGRTSPHLRRIGQLAVVPALQQAQQWFSRERSWINEQHLQLCRIAAPTFFEGQRAAWFRLQMETLGWFARLDRAGNVLTTSSDDETPRPFVISAHLDTVFAPGRPEEVRLGAAGSLNGPGVSDNGSGLTALLALARVLKGERELQSLADSVTLVANVGEEGEGNLSGMRYLCRPSSQLAGISAFLVLDGPSTDHITAQALASRRFEVSFSGPGGHSWNDSGTPNPVHAIGRVIANFTESAEARISGERRGRCSYNFGVVDGGSSVNSIPAMARAKLDLRSEASGMLDELTSLLSSAVERSLESENRNARGPRLTAKIRDLGSRPGGKLPDGSPLLQAIQAVDAFLHIRSRVDCASTDANVPLSLGLPAVSIGAGGRGGGAHTSDEWYQPDGRDLGLRRILLVLASLADSANSAKPMDGSGQA